MSDPTRREAIGALAALSVGRPGDRRTGLIREENAKPGTTDWQLTYVRFDTKAKYRHGDPADIPGLEIVAAGKTRNGGDQESHYEATIYPGPKGNTVFNAATIFWAQGLSSPPGHWLPFVHNGRPHGPDARVQKITRNLLQNWIGS
jgi:hypothetical protein